MSAAANRPNRADIADVDDLDKMEFSDNDSDGNEELNFNSNNGNDLDDSDSPVPTICVYGNNGMAGPLDLDITHNNELHDDSHCECNVSTFSVICYYYYYYFFFLYYYKYRVGHKNRPLTFELITSYKSKVYV